MFVFSVVVLPPVLVPRQLPLSLSSDNASSCSSYLPSDKLRDFAPTTSDDDYHSPPTVSVSHDSVVPLLGPAGERYLKRGRDVVDPRRFCGL